MSTEITNVIAADEDVVVCVTVDFDADFGHQWRNLTGRLTSISERRFGAIRGVPRLIELFASRDIPATFYVPGEIAQRYTSECRAIMEHGHEIGHHGHIHLFNDQADEEAQRRELFDGLAALDRCLGIRPVGYRSPGWELTPETLRMLCAEGFRWDSSCMGDDRPYVESSGNDALLELPVHWSLDDWVFYGFARDTGGPMSHPAALDATWRAEFLSALNDRRPVTFTLHPECSGRGYRARWLAAFLDWMRQQGRVAFLTHGDLAERAAGVRA